MLEETYKKWVQYKDDCLKAMSSESVLPGMESFKHFADSFNLHQIHFSSIVFLLIIFLFTTDLFCNRTFDRYACWPDTPAGSTVNISCPFYLPWYDKGRS